MKANINEALGRHIKENLGVYFTVTLFFAIGLAAGAFTAKSLESTQKQDLILYLNRFFQVLGNEKIKNTEIFLQSIKNNFQTIFFIWLFGVTFIGIPFTLLVTSFRGFIIGFTIAFLVQGLGWKGFLFTLAAVIPQNILYIPCLLIISSLSLCFSLQAFKKKLKGGYVSTIRDNMFSYTTTILIVFALMCLGSLIEAYLSPILLKIMSSYMIVK